MSRSAVDSYEVLTVKYLQEYHTYGVGFCALSFNVAIYGMYTLLLSVCRCEDAADMSAIEQNKVEAIANDVETKLFNLNGDINPKYKNKYRSLVFNLKDIKNQVDHRAMCSVGMATSAEPVMHAHTHVVKGIMC